MPARWFDKWCPLTGKQRHPTYGDAARHLAQARRRKHQALSVYRCRACGSFHVGRSKTDRQYERAMREGRL